MQPKVSILIPCYNAERWVAQAIQSALDQTYPNKEVIVVDDGSTDSSLEVIKQFSYAIRWETGPNHGGNIARNRLLELSEGEWIQYLDADDYLKPKKVEQQVQCLNHHPQADIIYSPSVFEYWSQDTFRQEVLPIPKPHDPWILLARWYLPQTGSPLWRKQAIADVDGWKPDQPCCQEHELYLRLLKAEKHFEYCPDTGSVYRQWSEKTVCKRDKSETFRQRLLIENLIEKHLRDKGKLTRERLYAINQARFECARIIWNFDRDWSIKIVKNIKSTDRRFLPSGNSAPILYKFIYKMFGFSVSEYLASMRRKVMAS